MVSDAEAKKASGKPIKKFSQNSVIQTVCGDKLCSEILDPTSQQKSDMIGVAQQSAASTLPRLFIDDIEVFEDVGQVEITVRLDSPTVSTVYFDYRVDIAHPDPLFQAKTGTPPLRHPLNDDFDGKLYDTTDDIPAGQQSRKITFKIQPDNSYEADEKFGISLSHIEGALIGDAWAIVTIKNDDPLPILSIDDAQVTELDSDSATDPLLAKTHVRMNAASVYPVAFDVIVIPGIASAQTDYSTPETRTLTISPGTFVSGLQHFIRSDAVNEETETFTVKLSNPTSAIIGDDTATVTIYDNDRSSNTAIPSTFKKKPSNHVVTKLEDSLTKFPTDGSNTVKKLTKMKKSPLFASIPICESASEPTNFINHKQNPLYHFELGQNYTLVDIDRASAEMFGGVIDLSGNLVMVTVPGETSNVRSLYTFDLDSQTYDRVILDELINGPDISDLSFYDDTLVIGLPMATSSTHNNFYPYWNSTTSSFRAPGFLSNIQSTDEPYSSGMVLVYDIPSKSLRYTITPFLASNFGSNIDLYDNKLLVTDTSGAYIYTLLEYMPQLSYELHYPDNEIIVDVDMSDKYVLLRTSTKELITNGYSESRHIPSGIIVTKNYAYDQNYIHVFDITDGTLIRTIPVVPAFSTLYEKLQIPYYKTIKIHGDMAVIGYPSNDGSNVQCVNCMNNGVASLIDLNTGEAIQTYHNPDPGRNKYFGSSVNFDGHDVLIGNHIGTTYIFDKKSFTHYNKIITSHTIASGNPIELTDSHVVIGNPFGSIGNIGTYGSGVVNIINKKYADNNNNDVLDKDEYLSPPTLISPENNANVSVPEFKWTPIFSDEINYYHLQIFESDVTQNNDPKYNIYVPYSKHYECSLEKDKQYSWRVRTIDFDGNKGEFSSLYTFTTNP